MKDHVDGPGTMKCGHPLAARQISVVDGKPVTTCWACGVQREVDYPGRFWIKR